MCNTPLPECLVRLTDIEAALTGPTGLIKNHIPHIEKELEKMQKAIQSAQRFILSIVFINGAGILGYFIQQIFFK